MNDGIGKRSLGCDFLIPPKQGKDLPEMAVAYAKLPPEASLDKDLLNEKKALFPTACDASTKPEKSIQWYALCVRSRYEKLTALMLTNKGYENLLPLYRCSPRRPDRHKDVRLPLFPGYLFCRFDVSVRLPILTTPGVMHIVGRGRIPVPVDEAEMEAIRRLAVSPLQAEPCQYLEVGQKVYISGGPLEGIVGDLVAVRNAQRLVLSVTLLRRSVAVELDRDWVSPESMPRLK